MNRRAEGEDHTRNPKNELIMRMSEKEIRS